MEHKKDLLSIARETLEIEAKTLLDASIKIDNSFIEAMELIAKCSGKLIVTGVGKSGLVGSKLAATFASTGTPSFFIHPTEALHGDLGMIDNNDIVLAISYSGESEELIKIIPHIKRFEIPLIGMSSNKNSTLSRSSEVFIDIKVDKEACPLNVAPTSSTTLTMALGDALAVILMHKRGFTKEKFASFHPGGSLGKKLFVKALEIARKNEYPLISKNASIKDAIVVMTKGKLGSVILVDDRKICGILSDGDLRRGLMSENFNIEDKAINYATKNPKIIYDQTILASDALKIIEDNKIQILIIASLDNSIIGVLHIHDLVEAGIK